MSNLVRVPDSSIVATRVLGRSGSISVYWVSIKLCKLSGFDGGIQIALFAYGFEKLHAIS